MPTACRLALASSLLALLALVGCARDGQDWSAAQDADTQEAYDDFLAKHPQSEFAAKATERASQLVEERDWAVATQSDTPEAYRKFIDQHADGKWTQEARIRVENFNVMAAAAPEVAPGALPAAPTPTPAKSAPGPRPPVARASVDNAAAAAQPSAVATSAAASAATVAATAAARARAATPGDHRVQLGAFSSLDKAEAEWQRVRARFAPLSSLEPRIAAVQTASGRLFRLQAALPDAAAARALCDTLKAAGQACLYVPTK